MIQSRRTFLAQLGMASTIPFLGFRPQPAAPAASIKFGYSAITWGDNIEQAIREISSLGFTGIQLRSNAVAKWGQKPEELKRLLEGARLDVVMLSSGNADINTGNDEAQIAKHVVNAKFIKAVGGSRMQVTNSSRPKTGAVSNEDLIKYAKMLTEIGKRTADAGVETTYHNHMGQLGQTPQEVDTILQNTDPGRVGFLLDVAHYLQGGGDPAAAVRTYKDRIKTLHIKDVKNTDTPSGYQFVELGQGRLDFPAVFDALNKINYRGYAVVELDAIPVKGRTTLESGQIAKDFITNKMKFKM